jgi:CheY-like chemotaxis protein
MKERVLIITRDSEEQGWYELLLEYKGYVTTVLKDESAKFRKGEGKYTKELIQAVLNLHPQLIVCDIGSYAGSVWDIGEVFEFLLKVRKAYGEDKSPPNLVILPRDFYPYEYEFLLDDFLTGPVAPDLFWDVVEKLVTQKEETPPTA